MISNYEPTLLSVEHKNSASRLFSHSHIFHQIIYICNGSTDIDINGKKYTATAPCVVVVSSLEPHSFDSKGKNYERYCLAISTDVVDKGHPISDLLSFLTQRKGDFSHVINVTECESQLRCILGEICSELDVNDSYSDFKKDIKLYELLVLLHRCIPGISVCKMYGNSLMLEIQNYIEEKYRDDISVIRIAKEFGISQSTLSHTFKEVTGYSVLEYITMCRMTEARNLLSETDMPVTEIALNVGYCNITNFSRMFRLKNNCTPVEYRNAARSYKPSGNSV